MCHGHHVTLYNLNQLLLSTEWNPNFSERSPGPMARLCCPSGQHEPLATSRHQCEFVPSPLCRLPPGWGAVSLSAYQSPTCQILPSPLTRSWYQPCTWSGWEQPRAPALQAASHREHVSSAACSGQMRTLCSVHQDGLTWNLSLCWNSYLYTHCLLPHSA